jgi:hypothetical protein
MRIDDFASEPATIPSSRSPNTETIVSYSRGIALSFILLSFGGIIEAQQSTGTAPATGAPRPATAARARAALPVWLEQDRFTIERIDWTRVAAVSVMDPSLRLNDANGNALFESRNAENVLRVVRALQGQREWLALPGTQGGRSVYVRWARVVRVTYEEGEQPRVRFFATEGSGRPSEFITAEGTAAVRATRARIAAERSR